MRPEARPIEFTNGRTHFYSKKKVDTHTHTHTFFLKESNNFIQQECIELIKSESKDKNVKRKISDFFFLLFI